MPVVAAVEATITAQANPCITWVVRVVLTVVMVPQVSPLRVQPQPPAVPVAAELAETKLLHPLPERLILVAAAVAAAVVRNIMEVTTVEKAVQVSSY